MQSETRQRHKPQTIVEMKPKVIAGVKIRSTNLLINDKKSMFIL